MDPPPALLTAFPASADLLLDIVRRQVDDGMLAEIAAADYGMDMNAHLTELRTIRDQGIVPTPLPWHPGEVLELIRWSNPENPAHKPGSTGRRGHQMRAFACAAILRAGMGDGGDSESHVGPVPRECEGARRGDERGGRTLSDLGNSACGGRRAAVALRLRSAHRRYPPSISVGSRIASWVTWRNGSSRKKQVCDTKSKSICRTRRRLPSACFTAAGGRLPPN